MLDSHFEPAAGGCACGALRFVVERAPLYVHCCHCTRCQRETGAPFAHHAMVAWCDMRLERGEPTFVQVPTDSGTRHWVARCPLCHTVLWNEWGSRQAVTRYVRVGVFDEPARFPPQAHIYLRSRQPWLQLGGEVPGFAEYYGAEQWPAESRARWRAAKEAKEAKGSKAANAAGRIKAANAAGHIKPAPGAS